jgi:uncharacterized protein with ParB-like and HNH nuclease domain
MRIPDYQRGYTWGEDQLNDFWKDLINLKLGRSHYIGVLTIEKVEKTRYTNWEDDIWAIEEKSYSPFYVVDGQQRLLTSIIIIQTIIENLKDGEVLNYDTKEEIIKKYLYLKRPGDSVSKTFLFGYEKDDPSFEYFKTKILGQLSNSNAEIETLYTSNLLAAKIFFAKKVKVMKKEEVEAIYKKLTQSLKFNVYEIEDDIDVSIAFETMNNRGKKLSNLELLKNRLIYLSTAMEGSQVENQRLRSNINDAWKQIYRYLGAKKEKPLDDDEFLNDHWKMYFPYSRKSSEQYKLYLLNEHFTIDNVLNKKVTVQTIQKYIDSLQESIAIWYKIQNPEEILYSFKIKEMILKLERIGFTSFKPLLMAVLLRNRETEPNKTVLLLQGIERFIFLVIKLSRKNSSIGDSSFYALARNIYFLKENLDCALKYVDLWISGGIDCKGVKHEAYFNLEIFKTYLRDSFKNKRGGFAGWSGIRYFLFEYENFLMEKSGNGNPKVSWDEFVNEKKGHSTIEHIFPQNSREHCWIDKFKDYNSQYRYNLCNSLGNLLALSRGKNSSLQDFCYLRKRKDDEGNMGYFNGSFSEIEVAENYDDWGEEQIKERGLKLLEFMENHWSISFGPIDEKIKTLNLDQG